MITMEQYVGVHEHAPNWTAEVQLNAANLLIACAKLEEMAKADGVKFPDNPKTGNGVSGDTLGGFRPKVCSTGAGNSSHKEGKGVDRYDPLGHIDAWCMANQDKLAECGIYIEHPSKTEGWSHWTTRRPNSGNRVFMP